MEAPGKPNRLLKRDRGVVAVCGVVAVRSGSGVREALHRFLGSAFAGCYLLNGKIVRIHSLGLFIRQLIERRVEEDISIGGIRREKVEWRVAGSDDSDWTLNNLLSVEVREIATVPQRRQLRNKVRPCGWPVGFEVDEKNERLGGIGVKDATQGTVLLLVELSDGILLFEDIHKRVYVKAPQSPTRRQGRCRMTNVKLPVNQPDVRFHANASSLQCRIQRNATPIVVVRVTSNWYDISRGVRRPVGEVVGVLTSQAPGVDGPVEVIGEEGDYNTAKEDEELDNASTCG